MGNGSSSSCVRARVCLWFHRLDVFAVLADGTRIPQEPLTVKVPEGAGKSGRGSRRAPAHPVCTVLLRLMFALGVRRLCQPSGKTRSTAPGPMPRRGLWPVPL
jgi:hypothetical protein